MKLCGSNWVKIEKAQLKISLHKQTDSALLNADKKLSKNHGDLMLPDWDLLQLKVPKNADKRRHENFSWTLHYSNSVKMHRIIIVLLLVLISIQWTIGLCKLTFNWAPLIFTQFEPHEFTCVVVPCCAQIKVPILWKLPGFCISMWIFWLQMWYSFHLVRWQLSHKGVQQIKIKSKPD